MLVCKHDGEAGVQVPLLPNPSTGTTTCPNFRIDPVRLQPGVSRTFPRIHPRTKEDHLRRVGPLDHTVETRTGNAVATRRCKRSIATSCAPTTNRLRELLGQAREVSSVQVETQEQGISDVHNLRVQLQKRRVEAGENVGTSQYRVVTTTTGRLRTDHSYSFQGLSGTLLRVHLGRNQRRSTTKDSIYDWGRCRTHAPTHTFNRRKDQQSAQLSQSRKETRQSAAGNGAQTERFNERGESQATSSTNTLTNQRPTPRSTTQVIYSTDPRKPNGDDRRFVGTQHGTEPQFSEVNLGRWMVRVQAATGIQSRMVRASSNRNRPLVSQQQNVFSVRTHHGVATVERSQMGVFRLFRDTRQGCQCSESYSGRGAHGFSLWRRCKTFPLLEQKGYCQ